MRRKAGAGCGKDETGIVCDALVRSDVAINGLYALLLVGELVSKRHRSAQQSACRSPSHASTRRSGILYLGRSVLIVLLAFAFTAAPR